MKTTIDMAREAGIIDFRDAFSEEHVQAVLQDLKAFEALVRADERDRAAPVQEPEHIVHSNGRYSPLLTNMMNKRVESNVKQVIHLYDEPAPVQEPVACKTLCELCLKRGYDFCANTAKTTPIPTPPAQPAPVPIKPIVDPDLDVNQRLAFKLGWRSAEEAHGITKGQP
jgi:hypothetical protein